MSSGAGFSGGGGAWVLPGLAVSLPPGAIVAPTDRGAISDTALRDKIPPQCQRLRKSPTSSISWVTALLQLGYQFGGLVQMAIGCPPFRFLGQLVSAAPGKKSACSL